MKEKEREIQKLKEEHHLALSRISHEIRNPVTLINSSMQLIEAEHPEVLSFDLWDDMKKDMLFLRRLLDELSGYNNGEKIRPEALELSSFRMWNSPRSGFETRSWSMSRPFSRVATPLRLLLLSRTYSTSLSRPRDLVSTDFAFFGVTAMTFSLILWLCG